MKHQDINLRERVSTTQLIKEVISVNESIKANQNGSRGIANPIKLLVNFNVTLFKRFQNRKGDTT